MASSRKILKDDRAILDPYPKDDLGDTATEANPRSTGRGDGSRTPKPDPVDVNVSKPVPLRREFSKITGRGKEQYEPSRKEQDALAAGKNLT